MGKEPSLGQTNELTQAHMSMIKSKESELTNGLMVVNTSEIGKMACNTVSVFSLSQELTKSVENGNLANSRPGTPKKK